MFVVSKREPSVLYVETETMTSRTITKSVSASGSISEILSQKLYPSYTAKVGEIYVSTGDFVEEGQVLMSLITTNDISVFGSVTEMFSEVDMENYMDAVQTLKEAMYAAGGEGTSYIISPFSGIVTDIKVTERETVNPLVCCAEISDISRMQAVVNISEGEMNDIKVGMPADVVVTSLGVSYQGVVLEVSPRIIETSTLTGGSSKYSEAIIEILNPGESIAPGSSAEVKILTSRKSGVISVPYEAVNQDINGNEFVYVVSNGKAEKRIVQTGYEFDGRVELTSGIIAGERVLVSADEEVFDGAPVKEK